MTSFLEQIAPGAQISPQVKEQRAEVLGWTAAVHGALIETDDEHFSHADRVALAQHTAVVMNDPQLQAWFGDLAEDAGPASPGVVERWGSLIAAMVRDPRSVDAVMIDGLVAVHGQTPVVIMTQLISSVAYLSRLVFAVATPVDAPGTVPPRSDTLVTMKARTWQPYLAPMAPGSDSPAAVAAFAATGPGAEKSDYYRVLARDPESLRTRSSLYNLIMYGEGGLDHGSRELAALWTSIRNGCPYCASVHIRRFQTHRDRASAERVLAAAQQQWEFPAGIGSDQLSESEQAVVAIAEALTDRDGVRLRTSREFARQQGLSEVELFDLFAAIAVFGWANRLMLALGSSHESSTG